ncbi:MAG: hypothetical protein JWR77_2603 [Rhizorhabdus sp.]|nr:hypothetical protein [Rhizorhabdus sp.]
MSILREKAKGVIDKELRSLLPGQPPPPQDEKVADFSYTSDVLAEMIVTAWTDANFKAKLLDPNNAKALLEARGFYLQKPVVITEDDYNNHYKMKDDTEVVLVLPDERRVQAGQPGQNLLETARLLMACVPNGI